MIIVHVVIFLCKCKHCFLFIVYVSSVVKEEIVDDDAHLPCFNGRVISWVNITS
jgi:hypothetical protein